MADRLGLFTIPATRSFADALVAGLIRRAGPEPLALARGIVLLPNNRAVRAVTDAFVRASGGALLLPRLVALGDPEAGEAAGAAIDAADADPVLPAVPAYRRRMILARLVAEERVAGVRPDPAESVRLAGDLARTLDQLLVEEVAPTRLAAIELGPELTEHWSRALEAFTVLTDRWPAELARMNMVDAATRRARLLDALAARWRVTPPPFVCAAGVTDPAPSVARLLRTVAGLPNGSVVFAGLDLSMDAEEWDALGPFAPDPSTGLVRRSIETHPQFHLKLLLDRMDVARGEVATWRDRGGPDSDAARGRAIANALAPAEFTGRWTGLAAADRRLTGVSAAEFATPAEEAQAIALALRGALEVPGRTAALVTPDRALARRVATHLTRWNIRIDDSAGQPLSILPPGTLLVALVEAVAQDLAPPALLALLKHPLVRAGSDRLAWLDGVRALDLQLRGPRPAAGMSGLDDHAKGQAALAWADAKPCLEPLCAAFTAGPVPLAQAVALVREAADA
ncbi:MAG TPA: double-strand break repair protein AddB, partial [Sphingomonas sp.]